MPACSSGLDPLVLLLLLLLPLLLLGRCQWARAGPLRPLWTHELVPGSTWPCCRNHHGMSYQACWVRQQAQQLLHLLLQRLDLLPVLCLLRSRLLCGICSLCCQPSLQLLSVKMCIDQLQLHLLAVCLHCSPVLHPVLSE